MEPDNLETSELQRPLARRYDGDERRRPIADYHGAERRVGDPLTEQDHPEEYELQPGDLPQIQ